VDMPQTIAGEYVSKYQVRSSCASRELRNTTFDNERITENQIGNNR